MLQERCEITHESQSSSNQALSDLGSTCLPPRGDKGERGDKCERGEKGELGDKGESQFKLMLHVDRLVNQKKNYFSFTCAYDNKKLVSINFLVKEPIFEAKLSKVFSFIPRSGPKTVVLAEHQRIKK